MRIAFLLIVGAALAAGQSVKFTANSNLVIVDVVVRESRARPLRA